MRPASGYRLLPHTADVMISAWAPTVEGCLARAVRGLVSCFADVAQLRPKHMVAFACAPASESELLVELLDEAIYVVDALDVVPVQVGVARTEDGGLVGEFGVVARADVTVVGPAPKAVTRHGLRFEQEDSIWRCQVVVDV
jgi:SHS2 domain-containing protein